MKLAAVVRVAPAEGICFRRENTPQDADMEYGESMAQEPPVKLLLQDFVNGDKTALDRLRSS
jgi:hypothetical protein